MAGGGSPRQKMIGMMYLVLTALLALNVQKSVLDSFVIVNEGLEKTTENFAQKNANVYRNFDKALKDEKTRDKAKPYADLAKEVKAKCDDLVKYIDEMKRLVIKETDKKEKAVADTLKLRNVDAKDNFDTPAQVLLGEETNPKKGPMTISDLKARINKLREELTAIFDKKQNGKDLFFPDVKKEMKEKLEGDLETKDPPTRAGAAKETWEIEKVLHVPLAAVVTNLTAIQANIRNAESDVVTKLLGSIGADDFKFDKLTAKVIAEKSYLIQGDEYKADVLLVAFNSTSNPEMVSGPADTTKGEDVDPMRGPGTPIKVEGGIGRYRAGTGSAGVQRWSGCIKVPKPSGGFKFYPFAAEYEVAPPALVVSPTKMNVFYKGVDNPVSISVPGIPSSSLFATIDGGGSLTPDPANKGSYIVRMPPSAPTKVFITVTAKIGNATKPMGKLEFRTKPLPDPVALCGTVKSSGPMAKALFKSVGAVIAKYENFDFELPVKVRSFTLGTYVGGEYKSFEQKAGNLFTPDQTNLIDKAKNNAKFIIEDIKVSLPDGSTRVLNTLSITIKG